MRGWEEGRRRKSSGPRPEPCGMTDEQACNHNIPYDKHSNYKPTVLHIELIRLLTFTPQIYDPLYLTGRLILMSCALKLFIY